MDERRGGRLALRAGDADRRGSTGHEEQRHLHLDARPVLLGDPQEWRVAADVGVADHDVGPPEVGLVVAPQHELDRGAGDADRRGSAGHEEQRHLHLDARPVLLGDPQE